MWLEEETWAARNIDYDGSIVILLEVLPLNFSHKSNDVSEEGEQKD